MMKSFIGEEWREINIDKGTLQKRYAVSNFGRVASFTEKLEKGNVLKNRKHGDYLSIAVKPGGKSVTWLLHRLVAEYFLPIPEAGEKFVIHLDYNKRNNKAENLRWANQKALTAHNNKSPEVIKYKNNKRAYINFDSYTLSETRVSMLKRIINDPKRKTKMKTIAKQFGISEMQLYRIKKGIHWGHVK
jgi:hypothetical protein